MNEAELHVLVFLIHGNGKLLAPSFNVIGEFNNKGGGRVCDYLGLFISDCNCCQLGMMDVK